MKNIFTKNNKIFYFNKGFTIIEVLIACVIISTTTLALMSAATKGVELSSKALNQVQANMLLEEGIEAVKSIRDSNWANISILNLETDYYLSFDNNTNIWSLSVDSGTPIDEIFTRTISFSEVQRDIDDNIASSGTIDDDTKKVRITVSWPTGNTTNTKNLDFYLTNFFN